MTLITKYDEEMNPLKTARGKAIQSKIAGKVGNLSARIESANRMKKLHQRDYHHPAIRRLRKSLGDEVSKAIMLSSS
jgi:hypothetical protein